METGTADAFLPNHPPQSEALRILAEEFERRRIRNPRYSMRAFAKAIGISQSQLSLILSGKRRISVRQAMKIAKVAARDVGALETLLGVPIGRLIETEQMILLKKEAPIRFAQFAAESNDEQRTRLSDGFVMTSEEWPRFCEWFREQVSADPEYGEAHVIVKVLNPGRQ